jgi:putative endonuclease
MTAERLRRYRLGRLAESLCAWHLRLRGYRVLARRFRSPVGEIDLVVRRGSIVAFIEVKARLDQDQGWLAITPRQRARVRRAAELFIARQPRLAGCAPRFDVMVVTPRHLPRHMIDAWRD